MRSRFLAVCAATVSLLAFAACSSQDGGTAPDTDVAGSLSTAAQANGTSAANGGLTGTVSLLSGACPTLSFKLEGKIVKTVAATRFDGGACADVKNGGRVTVTGPTQSDGSIQPEKVTLLATTTTPTTPPPPTATTLHITGTISGITGSCPGVQFTLEAKTIKISAATTYERGACATLGNAIRVTATGTTQADGSVAATRVAFQP